MHKPTLQITKERLQYSRLGVFHDCKIDLRLEKSSHVIHYINRIERKKNHKIICVDRGILKSNQYAFIILEKLNELGIEKLP